jgi:hypothetical protein
MVGRLGLDACDSVKRLMEGCFEHGNETSGFIKDAEFLAQLSDSQLPKKDCARWS